MVDSNARSRQAVTHPLQPTPIMMVQIHTMMCGELASPGVRHSRVQQNTSGLPNALRNVIILQVDVYKKHDFQNSTEIR